MALKGLSTLNTLNIFTTDILPDLKIVLILNQNLFRKGKSQFERRRFKCKRTDATYLKLIEMSETQTTSMSRTLNAERRKAPWCSTSPYVTSFRNSSNVNMPVKNTSN